MNLTLRFRHWPGAERIRAPLKAFDRLLGNRHLYAERERVYANMARWLLRSAQPVIVVDGSDLKADKSWCLLRAAVPVGGRSLPILDMVFPGSQAGSPKAEQRFLERLEQIVPAFAPPFSSPMPAIAHRGFVRWKSLAGIGRGVFAIECRSNPWPAHAEDDWVPPWRCMPCLIATAPETWGSCIRPAPRHGPAAPCCIESVLEQVPA